MFSRDCSAHSLTCRAVAAIKKWGSGRKKIRREAAASRRIWFGDVLENASRRVTHVEETFVKSSMLWRYSGRRSSSSNGRARRLMTKTKSEFLVEVTLGQLVQIYSMSCVMYVKGPTSVMSQAA